MYFSRLMQQVFSVWTRGPTHSLRNGDAQCCQLSNSADPFSDLFPFKKAPKPLLVSENRRYCRTSLAFPACALNFISLSLSLYLYLSPSVCSVSVHHAHTHISLALCICSVLFSARQRRAELNSVKHRY